jgi:membrane-associated phospholipid phosphatase
MARALPFLIAVFATLLIATAVRMEPYFAGDVTVARTVQGMSPNASWATTYTRTATSPVKWGVAAIALAVCYALGGWPGALFFVVALALEQALGEAVKSLFMRPRPSPDLIRVVGTPSGYSFPSTFMTFHTVVIGSIWLLARRAAPIVRRIARVAAPVLLVVGWACRVVVGAHWPSDVVLTTVLFGMWLVLLQHVILTAIEARTQPLPIARIR